LVDVPGDNTTTATVTVGSTTNGDLEVVGDHDWYKINLTAGQAITIQINGVTLEDPYLIVRNSAGALVYENDDISSGVIRDSKLSFSATYSGVYYIDVGAFSDAYAGTYQVVVSTYTPPPLATVDQLADQLVNGYWGGDHHHFDVTQGGTITVNISGLTPAGQTLARAAFDLWTDVIGVHFSEVTTGGQIVINDDDVGAYTNSNWANGIIDSSIVNISTQWLTDYGTTLNSYSFQTFVHEIGHALGLGHEGNYNDTANYPYDSNFQNDSWATSVMSYFSQHDNTYFAGQGFSEDFAVTPMMADIVAMQTLYGLSTTTRAGNTTYGFNSNAGRAVFDATQFSDVAYTIVDSGGIDTLDYSGFSANQTINLNPETFSNVGSNIGNVSIARGTIIENAIGGSGNDTLIGNDAANWLQGNGGNDTLNGGSGNDRLSGGSGSNTLNGGSGVDTADYSVGVTAAVTANLSTGTATYNAGLATDAFNSIENLIGSSFADKLTGNSGANVIEGGAGNDTLNGGAGIDTVSYTSATAGVTVNLGIAVAQNTVGAGSDTLFNFENLSGSSFADTLTGNGGDNVITGRGGADILAGGGGNDSFVDTAAGLNGDTINDFGVGDRIIISNATLAGFTYSLVGNKLSFTGGSVTLSNIPAGMNMVASAVASGGVELTMRKHDPANDFNGDGKSDVLLRHDGGLLTNWLGQGNGTFVSNQGTASYRLDVTWHVVNTGDFNGDGRDDLLLRNDSGTLAEWLGQANGTFASNKSYNLDLGWHTIGTGDFNGDGRDDLILRNDSGTLVEWLGQSNGAFVSNKAYNLDPAWKVVGTGDFNGDGRADLMLRQASGLMTQWLGQADGSFASNKAGTYNLDVAWHVVGTGDFNGDGRDDLLLRRDDGALTDWLGQANGSFVGNATNANYALGSTWHVDAIGDYNGDGRDDLLLRDDAGNLIDWLGLPSGAFASNKSLAHYSLGDTWHTQPLHPDWIV